MHDSSAQILCKRSVQRYCAHMAPPPHRPEADPDAEYTGIRLDSAALKVLAHPLRSRLLGSLRIGGPATATDLAAALGTNSGATSYHLRKLEAVGLVSRHRRGRGQAPALARPPTDVALLLTPATSPATRTPRRRSTGSRATTCATSPSSPSAGSTPRRGWPIAWRDAVGHAATTMVVVDRRAARRRCAREIERGRRAATAGSARATRRPSASPPTRASYPLDLDRAPRGAERS